ncbi:hypothetical protein HNY73_007681 [Argiope bruennichi]|uniref:Uncharacterized protein n=1 Tax=Argiope bruennichi TaxID=94029 RepID=A0A8T0FHR8_ARGBR|nr:hypothetical protein HNY73_007681 [Argiope bruennichi]
MPDESCKVVVHPYRMPRRQHERRYNVPTSIEIAVVIAGSKQTTPRDIVLRVLRASDGILSRIADTHRSYDALEYPIIFWKGQEGYPFDIHLINPNSSLPISNKIVVGQEYGGKTTKIKIRSGVVEVEVNNSSIVPFSPLLTRIFNTFKC